MNIINKMLDLGCTVMYVAGFALLVYSFANPDAPIGIMIVYVLIMIPLLAGLQLTEGR